MGYLDLVREALKDRGRILDGHEVVRVIWRTDRMVIFQDDQGLLWRYISAWGRAWPVEVVGKDE